VLASVAKATTPLLAEYSYAMKLEGTVSAAQLKPFNEYACPQKLTIRPLFSMDRSFDGQFSVVPRLIEFQPSNPPTTVGSTALS
jgi:hypothetical protein